MARTTVTLTDTLTQVATVACVVRVREVPLGASKQIALNETADEATALLDAAVAGAQYSQNETKATFAKGDGIVITVDAVG